MAKATPPVSYQGAKQRLAGDILDVIRPRPEEPFADLCAGSGAVSVELVNRGHDPALITMVDVGPWGMLWKSVGEGTFSLGTLRYYVEAVPEDLHQCKDFLSELATQDPNVDTHYVYLLLQAGAYGGKAVWIEGGKWRHPGFRTYWKPTATSKRRSPVTPMKPLAPTIYERMVVIAETMLGVRGVCARVEDTSVPRNAVVYIDPPYRNKTGYGYDVDAVALARTLPNLCYVSEGVPLSEQAVGLARGRRKGGVTGGYREDYKEWLSIFPAGVEHYRREGM